MCTSWNMPLFSMERRDMFQGQGKQTSALKTSLGSVSSLELWWSISLLFKVLKIKQSYKSDAGFQGLTICSYVVHWEVMYMRHVTDSWEDHEASQDTSERVGHWYNQCIPGKEKGQRLWNVVYCSRVIVKLALYQKCLRPSGVHMQH